LKYFQEFRLIDIANNFEFSKDNYLIYPKAIYSESGAENFHIYNQFTRRVQNRNELQKFLSTREIGSDIYYPVPLHRQECFAYLNANDTEFAITNRIADEVLSIPIFPELEEEQIRFVAESISDFYQK
ncbi:DegT/DnrJ/EryC1/StrS family aminotransferase, partial [bacterium]|nr:DegT/DnrJ/EryC1/StrS family aminotransferase [bacterium]